MAMKAGIVPHVAFTSSLIPSGWEMCGASGAMLQVETVGEKLLWVYTALRESILGVTVVGLQKT